MDWYWKTFSLSFLKFKPLVKRLMTDLACDLTLINFVPPEAKVSNYTYDILLHAFLRIGCVWLLCVLSHAFCDPVIKISGLLF